MFVVNAGYPAAEEGVKVSGLGCKNDGNVEGSI